MKGEEEYPDLNRDCNFNYSSNQMFQCLHRQIQEGHLGMSVCVRKKMVFSGCLQANITVSNDEQQEAKWNQR